MNKHKIATCGKRIEIALEVRKMKQSELCQLAHVPKSSLSLYIKGAYEPKQDRLFDMAIALNVSELWLMGYDVPMERDLLLQSTNDLSNTEMIMLELFRRIPENQQMVLIQMVRGALEPRG